MGLPRCHQCCHQQPAPFCHVLVDESTLDRLESESGDGLVEHLYRRIERLKDDERQLMTYVIGKVPLKEVAEIMGLTEDAVKHRIQRTKEKLRNMKDDYEE